MCVPSPSQIFNELHLRLRNERVGRKCVYLYYTPYKILLTGINVLSCYCALYKYAKYLAKRYNMPCLRLDSTHRINSRC